MAVNVTWRGPQVLAGIEAAVMRAFETAGKTLVAGTVRDVSTPWPPASRPGQPPHRRTGGLARGITHRVSRSGHTLSLAVGVPASSPVARQARALQGGTRRMAPRPFVPTARRATTIVVGLVAGAVRAETR